MSDEMLTAQVLLPREVLEHFQAQADEDRVSLSSVFRKILFAQMRAEQAMESAEPARRKRR